MSDLYTVGDRVVLVNDLDVFNLGSFPAGSMGTVVEIANPVMDTQPIAYVKFDTHFPDLNEWDNVIQICAPADGEVTWDVFAYVAPGQTAQEAIAAAAAYDAQHDEV